MALPRTGIFICSRGNPNKLSAVICSLVAMAGRPDLLTFNVRVDQDDEDTIQAMKRLEKEAQLNLFIGDRPASMGDAINQMILKNPDLDIYSILNDDTFPMTMHWDLEIQKAKLIGSVKGEAFFGCWNQTLGPVPDYPIFSRAYLDALDNGLPFTDLFPFWFDDMWAAAIATYIYGRPLCRVPINLMVKKSKTARMRDLAFWWEFFQTLEPASVQAAQRACDRLGLNIDILRDRPATRDTLLRGIAKARADAPNIEKALGDGAPPMPSYFGMKKQAQDIIAQFRDQRSLI